MKNRLLFTVALIVAKAIGEGLSASPAMATIATLGIIGVSDAASWGEVQAQKNREGSLASERVEDNLEDKEKKMETKPKSSFGSSWAELAGGSFELLDPYRVEGEMPTPSEAELESLRSLGHSENPSKTSGFRKFNENGIERERPPGWGKGQERKGALQAMRSMEVPASKGSDGKENPADPGEETLEALRATYQKPTSFRSNNQPETAKDATGTGGNEMEALRAQEKIEPSSPPMTNRQQAGKSWSELSQLESETVKEREEKEGSWGKSWGEVRSNVEDSANLNPARTQEEVEEKGDKVEVEEKEEERLEPERTMEGLSESSEDSNSLQAFRAVEKKEEPTDKENAKQQVTVEKREEPMDKEKQEAAKEQVASLFADTFHNMSQHGLQINMQKQAFQHESNKGCKENEIFFLDDNHMFLISSEKIVHDITGLADFENNLWSQIKNQDKIIKTLRDRLAAAEKQTENVNLIVSTLKSNNQAHQQELRGTQKLLDMTKGKVKSLENVTEHQVSLIQAAENEVAKMRLKLAEKDLAIKSLHDRLERGEAAEHIKHMQQELDMCMREKEVERNARIQLEKNLEQLNTTFILLRQSKFNTRDDMVLVQRELHHETSQVILLKEELRNHRKNIEDLNEIILEKDSIVQGLQDQVVDLTGREGRVLEGCLNKDRQIDAQYSALAGLNNLTVLQDTLSKAREVALRILQNTVYQMVEQIPQCSNTAITGLRKELEALQSERKPLEALVAEVKKTLEASKVVSNYKEQALEHTRYQSLLKSQSSALELCHQETLSQHKELAVKISKINKELRQPACSYDPEHCSAFCGKAPLVEIETKTSGGGGEPKSSAQLYMVSPDEGAAETTSLQGVAVPVPL